MAHTEIREVILPLPNKIYANEIKTVYVGGSETFAEYKYVDMQGKEVCTEDFEIDYWGAIVGCIYL